MGGLGLVVQIDEKIDPYSKVKGNIIVDYYILEIANPRIYLIKMKRVQMKTK